jgi:hypothetical protein
MAEERSGTRKLLTWLVAMVITLAAGYIYVRK